MVKTIGNVQKDAQVRAVASGALSNGDAVVVNSDDTVSVVSGTAEGFSSLVTYTTANIDTRTSTVFDSTNNKVVIAYGDTSNSFYGTAVVGTVSNNTITFGTPVVFESGECRDFSMASVGSGKVLICYRNQSSTNDGTGRVGTISGTSISFGSSSVFFTSASAISVGYDPVQGKGVVHYRKDTTPQYRVANVATISGTSVSFGSQTNLYTSTNAADERGYATTAFDSNSNKLFFAWIDSAFSVRTAVGTISGTSISFGTSVTAATGTQTYPVATFDSSTNKIILCWENNTNTEGSAVVGTISGTSVSFGTTVTYSDSSPLNNTIAVAYDANQEKSFVSFRLSSGTLQAKSLTVSGTDLTVGEAITTTNNQMQGMSSTYDSNEQRIVVAGEDGSTGEAAVLNPATSNLTSDNFIGFTDGAYADTQSAAINTTCSVDRSQTSLTAGEKYYVSPLDGTLSTTAGSPSVEAGTAISATEILVKG